MASHFKRLVNSVRSSLSLFITLYSLSGLKFLDLEIAHGLYASPLSH